MSEYLPLMSDDPGMEVVKGHCSPAEFNALLKEQRIDPFDPAGIKQGYGRYYPDSTKRFDIVFVLSEPGRGAFPVTYVEY